MPATYLPIKLNRGHRAKRHRSNMPARSARTGKFLARALRGNPHRAKRHRSTNVSRKRNLAGLKAARTRKRHESHRTNRPKHRRSNHLARRHRRNLPQGYHFTKPSKHRIGQGFPKGWSHSRAWDWTGPKRRSNRGRRHGGHKAKVRYRNRTVVFHKTKRLRNPVGFDSQDGLGSLGTWGKIGLAIFFGLGGLVIAFGIPKGLAVATGKDYFQRGWGGVVTSAVASVTVGGLVYLLSKRTGLGLLAAAGVGVGILIVNAISPKAAQYVIPINEATLAAMLPTFTPQRQAVGGDYRPSRDLTLSHVRGPTDFWPKTTETKVSSAGTEGGFYDSGYYGSPLATKERF